MPEAKEIQRSWAASIQKAGWRQGSIFRPTEDAADLLPGYLKLQPDEWLVVCTQSCSVCTDNFEKEPLLEIVVARPLAKYNPSHVDSKGRTSHTLQLPVSGIPGVAALECSLARRAFIQREFLRDWKPAKPWFEREALNSFKGWLGHYYTRIALPDELVARLRRDGGICPKIEAELLAEVEGKKVNEGVRSIYINWSTDDELPPQRPYGISLIIVCDDNDIKEFLGRKLAPLIGTPSAPLTIQGVILQELEIETADNLTLQYISGRFRFNEWDELSNWRQRVESMGAIG